MAILCNSDFSTGTAVQNLALPVMSFLFISSLFLSAARFLEEMKTSKTAKFLPRFFSNLPPEGFGKF